MIQIINLYPIGHIHQPLNRGFQNEAEPRSAQSKPNIALNLNYTNFTFNILSDIAQGIYFSYST